ILKQHALAYILCLLGSIVFSYSSGDTVPFMFLLRLDDLYVVDTYSCDSGTLAWLYRSLYRAVHSGVSQISENLLLLQVNKLEKKLLKLIKLKVLFQYLLIIFFEQLGLWEQFPIGRLFPAGDFDFQTPLFDGDILPSLGAS
ncbi:PMD domain-containing protein, partial [Cephalotus follicularis]